MRRKRKCPLLKIGLNNDLQQKLRIITKEVYIVLKKQAFMIIGMLLLTSLLVGCRMEMSRSEWCNRYGFAEDEVFDIEIGNYGFLILIPK